jgi:hypothetical protein
MGFDASAQTFTLCFPYAQLLILIDGANFKDFSYKLLFIVEKPRI